jgi:hypothetical protein
MEFALVGAGV